MIVSEVIDRKQAEKLWQQMAVPRPVSAASEPKVEPSTGQTYQIKRTEPQTGQTKSAVELNREMDRLLNKINRQLKPKLAQMSDRARATARIHSHRLPADWFEIDHEQYLLPRPGSVLYGAPMIQRYLDLINAYSQRTAQLQNYIKYPLKYRNLG